MAGQICSFNARYFPTANTIASGGFRLTLLNGNYSTSWPVPIALHSLQVGYFDSAAADANQNWSSLRFNVCIAAVPRSEFGTPDPTVTVESAVDEDANDIDIDLFPLVEHFTPNPPETWDILHAGTMHYAKEFKYAADRRTRRIYVPPSDNGDNEPMLSFLVFLKKSAAPYFPSYFTFSGRIEI